MVSNYIFKKPLGKFSLSREKLKEKKPTLRGYGLLAMMLLGITGAQAQTDRIPVSHGNFSNGSTLEANGWSAGNEGVNPSKWVLGTAVSAPAPASFAANGTLTLNSYNVTTVGAADIVKIARGYKVTGSGIPDDTYVVGTNGSNTVYLSKKPTSAGSGVSLTYIPSAANITGNSAYVSNDGGVTNSIGGYNGARTLYLYREVTVPANETAMTLKFDVKAPAAKAFSGNGWQVWAVPNDQALVGTDTQVTAGGAFNPVWAAAPGAVMLDFNIGSFGYQQTSSTTAFVPPAFATGTPFKLVFVWTNGSAATADAPAALDNITLVSREPNPNFGEDLETVRDGLWSDPGTWVNGLIPTPADAVVTSHSVVIDTKNAGASSMVVTESGKSVQFAVSAAINDQFTVAGNLIINNGARFNNHDGANTEGKTLRVGGNITVNNGGRFDSSAGNASKGILELNGSALQTVTIASGGLIGGTNIDGTSLESNTTANRENTLNNLWVTNTSSATPNVVINGTFRIISNLNLSTGRVSVTTGNRIILGNFGALNNITVPLGYGFTQGTVSKWINAQNLVKFQAGSEYPGNDGNFKSSLYPFISNGNADRAIYMLPGGAQTVAGEVAVTYADSNAMTTGLSIADGAYTINNRWGGNWTFSTPESQATGAAITYANANTFRVAAYANGAFEAKDGTSRLMYLGTALPGEHLDGTTQPYVVRTGLTLAELTAGAMYVGAGDASLVNTASAITSLTSGNWKDAATWVGGIVPSCNSNVVIAAGHTVTVTATANAANVVIRAGGTLVNNSKAAIMKVGCVNNNAAFVNYGTHTMTSGNLAVNGSMVHKLNSTFNQTGGEIIIDANDAGNAATSVAFGGSACKIETSQLSLTGGKITIVDPLVNMGPTITKTSITSFTAGTAKSAYMSCYTQVAATSGSSVVRLDMTPGQDGSLPVAQLYAGQPVSGPATAVQPGTTVVSWALVSGNNYDVTLSLPLIGNLAAYQSAANGLSFKYSNDITEGEFVRPTKGNFAAGVNAITLNSNNQGNAPYFVGQPISGPGIAPGTTITGFGGIGSQAALILSANTTDAIPSGTYLSFSSMFNGANGISLEPGASNSQILVGFGVSGEGIQAGTTVTAVQTSNGFTRVLLSLPVSGLGTSPITSQKTLTFSPNVAGATGAILPAADPDLVVGMAVSGAGIKPGTFITSFSGATVNLSEPLQAGVTSPVEFTAYPFNTKLSGAFVYASPDHYQAGLDHTLQIGNGVSTQNADTVTYGFNCQFMSLGGLFSIGNLTVDAPDGENRFMNVSSNMLNSSGYINVQNALTITEGSVFKKTAGTSVIYCGGNITNNGRFSNYTSGQLYLGTTLNGTTGLASALPQTISGSGSFTASEWANSPGIANVVCQGLTVNNTSEAGVTIAVPDFRTAGTFTLANGIVHTSAAYPLYVGDPNVVTAGGNPSVTANNGSATCYVDGPIAFAFNQNQTATGYKPLPTGKNGKFLPIQLAATGGVELMAEAFDTNSGTVANASALSAARWEVTRVGTDGSFTGYNVKLGASSDVNVTASDVIVHSATANGTYDLVSTPASAITYAVATFGFGINLPAINLTTAQTGGFLGNFAYAMNNSCAVAPAPGNTVASSGTVCSAGAVALSLENAVTGVGVTYQWQNSVDNGTTWNDISGATAATYSANPAVSTMYRCDVTCSGLTGTSTPVTVNMTQNVASVTGATICGEGTAELTATGDATLNWYDAATDGTLVATGGSYSPSVSETTTYYVASETSSSGNSTDTAPTTLATAVTANGKGISFDAVNKMKLKQVTVYPKNTAGNNVSMTIALVQNGTVLASTPFIPDANTGNYGAVATTVTLNYEIPAGTGYRLVVSDGLAATNNTLCTSDANVTYPATFGPIKVTGNVSTFIDAPAVAAAKMNCFFNMTYDEMCESATRTAVTATVQQEYPFYADADGDGIGAGSPVNVCSSSETVAPEGYSRVAGDCNDSDESVSITTQAAIATQPTNQVICNAKGQTATFTAEVIKVGEGDVTYQWKTQAPAKTTWTTLENGANVQGATTPTLTIVKSAPTGTKYRLDITGGCEPVSSDVATVTYAGDYLPKPGTMAPVVKGNTICSGSGKDLKISSSNGNVQVQSSLTGLPDSWTNFGGEIADTNDSAVNLPIIVNTGALTETTYFRALATNGPCTVPAVSPTFIMTVVDSPVAGNITGGGVTVCAAVAGNAVNTAVPNSTDLTLNGNTGTIAWYSSINGGLKWSPVKNATTASYTAANLKVTTMFKARSTNAGCFVETVPVTITVTPAAKAGKLVAYTNSFYNVSKVCMGEDLSFESTGHMGSVIQWEYSLVNNTSWTNFGTNSEKATLPYSVWDALTNNQRIYVRTTTTASGACTVNAKISAVKTITVTGESVSGAITGAAAICEGGSSTLKLSGAVGVIQWLYSVDGGNSYSHVFAGTNAYFTTASTGKAASLVLTNVQSSVKFMAKVINGSCDTAYTTPVDVIIGAEVNAGSISGEQVVCPGTNSQTLELTGAVGTIQWQKANVVNGVVGAFANITGKTGATLVTGNLKASTAYRAVVTVCTSVETEDFVVVVDKAVAKPVAVSGAGPTGAALKTAICADFSTPKTLTVAAGSFGTITWERSTNAGADWATIEGATGGSYEIDEATAGVQNWYRAVFTTSCAPTAYSTPVRLYYKDCASKFINSPIVEEEVVIAPFRVVAYPNPYTENFNLSLTTTSDAKVGLAVYDMTGRLLERREVAPGDISGQQFGDRYPTGVYNLILTQGSEVKTLRMVKR